MENIIPIPEWEYYCNITDKLDEYVLNDYKDMGYMHHLYKTLCMERSHIIAIYLKIGSVFHKLIGFIILDNNDIIKSIKLKYSPNYYKDDLDSISKEMTDLFKGNKMQFKT